MSGTIPIIIALVAHIHGGKEITLGRYTETRPCTVARAAAMAALNIQGPGEITELSCDMLKFDDQVYEK